MQWNALERTYFYKSNNDGDKIANPKCILEDEKRFFEEICASRNMNPNFPIFNENAL